MISFALLLLFLVRKTQVFILIRRVDTLVNTFLSKTILHFLWMVVYATSIPFLKFWLMSLNKKSSSKIDLKNFDFESEYKCVVEK